MQNGNDFLHVFARPPAGRGRSPTGSSGTAYSSPRARYGRVKSSRYSAAANPGVAAGPQSKSFISRLVALLVSYLKRRHAVLLLFPVIYISGMLLYMGTFPDYSHGPSKPRAGSFYRSPELFENLWPAMEAAESAPEVFGVERAWQFTESAAAWRPCLRRVANPGGAPKSNGYLVVEANGGLNQQRSSICNAVAVAYMLNATLVIPRFHLNSVWHDNSTFGQIYDQKHFVNSLADDVTIINKLPDDVYKRFGNLSNIYNFKIAAWAPADFYMNKVLPKLLSAGTVRFTPFANRLSFDNIPPEVQQLRCRVNFEALIFAPPILSVADTLVNRMIAQSVGSQGKYIGVHLRYEADMVAFSCCTYDGGEKEKTDMDKAREKGWRGKFTRRGKIIDPAANRRDGKCPLTPLEVGMMLRGMGFSNTTPIFLAAGKIYQAARNMAPLQKMFPYLHTKETLLTPEELEPFKRYSSRMAALDYTVCLRSEVFVTTQGGNFPQILIGHRRFLNKGHSKTIRPDKRKLAVTFDNPNISWVDFSQQLQAMRLHSDEKGHELRKMNASVYTVPAPDCMCPVDPDLGDEGMQFSRKGIGL